MNRELKGIMAKFDITQEMIGKELKLSLVTIGKKIRKGTFNQKEMSILLKYLQQYDNKIDLSIFLIF